jgi:hypothetical protein
MIGWIAACVLIALLSALDGHAVFGHLETKNEVKQEIVKVEKLAARKLEQKERKEDE